MSLENAKNKLMPGPGEYEAFVSAKEIRESYDDLAEDWLRGDAVLQQQITSAQQRDSGWRCWPVADWGPVTIGTQSGIVGQYQWLWRRIGSVVFYGARMKRDTALTVTSGQAVSSYRAISPHPMWMDMSFPESNVTGFISISFRDTNDPVPLTGNTPFSIFPSVGVFNVQAASTSVGGYVPGTWRSAISAANVTDAPWPDTLPGDPYGDSGPSLYLPPGEDRAVSGSALDWVNVTADGTVKGDGTTDDAAAIQAILDAAGVGATIYFPEGTYLLGTPLTPKRQQRLIGCHSPKYDPAEFPTTVCALKAKTGFTGTALIVYGSGAAGVTVESLCLLGLGTTAAGTLHGIDVGASTSGEKQWWMRSLTISGFSGAGLTGSLWVGDMRDCHIGRCGWAAKTYNAEAWTDVRLIGCQFYFNRNGGIELDTTKRSGAVTIMGCRVERSGNTYGQPGSPANANAPGIRLGNANNIELIGVTTDACTGPGLWVGTDVTDSSKIVYSVIVTGSEFLRDGGGDQTANAALPGVRLRGCSHVQFVGNTIGYGAHDDGNPGQLSPKYGLELEKATQCQIGYSRVETAVFANSLNIVGAANYGTALNLQPHGLFSFPVANEAAQPAKPLTGSSYYSTTDQKPRWWTGTKWVDALNGDGVYNPTLKPGVDLDGPDTTGKAVRFKVADIIRWVMSLRSATQSSNFTIDRHDAAGAYVDTPLTIRASDGRLDTNAQYVTAKSPSNIAMEVRPAAGNSVSIFRVADSAGASKLEVRWDGAVWVNGAPISASDVTKAYVDAADSALSTRVTAAEQAIIDLGFEVGENTWGYWTGTQAQYNALGTYDAKTLYVVTG